MSRVRAVEPTISDSDSLPERAADRLHVVRSVGAAAKRVTVRDMIGAGEITDRQLVASGVVAARTMADSDLGFPRDHTWTIKPASPRWDEGIDERARSSV